MTKATIKEMYNKVAKVVAELSDEQFEKMYEAYDKWMFGETSKSRFNYWLKKTGLTLEEWEVWYDC